jgi:hypothetical protein
MRKLKKKNLNFKDVVQPERGLGGGEERWYQSNQSIFIATNSTDNGIRSDVPPASKNLKILRSTF